MEARGAPLDARPLLTYLRSVVEARAYWLFPAGALLAWLSFLAFVLPYDPDEAVFKIVARGILDGRWPYRDFFDNKAPLLYVWYLPAALCRSLEVQRIGGALLGAASVGAMAAASRRWLAGRQVTFAVWAYALLLANPYLGVGTSVETFMLLPIAAAVAAPSALLAGALLGVATMTKPTAVILLPVLISLWPRQWWKVVAGWAGVCAIVLMAFVPVWRDLWVANVTFNSEFMHHLSLGYRLTSALVFIPFVVVGALPIWLLALRGVSARRHPVLLLWAVFGLIAVEMTGLSFAHYYALLAAPAALLAGQGLDRTLGKRRSFHVALAVGGLVNIALIVLAVAMTLRRPAPYADVANAIHRTEGDVYVLGDRAQIYALAGRQPERRLFFSIPLVVRADWGNEVRTDLESCPPAILVVPRHNLFEVSWAPDVEALYASRRSFDDAMMFTQPRIACQRSSRAR